MRNPKMEDYIDDYYSVHKFKRAYESRVGPMTNRDQWPKVDLGFKLWPPVLKRAAGRPRTRRYKGWEEGGTTRRTVTCKSCHQKGHMKKTCNETVLDPNAPPPAPPKPKRVRNKSKKKVTEVQTLVEHVEAPSAHVEATHVVFRTTPSKAPTPAMDNSSPMTRR
jgi:hypothetical protein